MKAGSNLLNAVSAVALTAGIVVTGAGAVTLAGVTVAEAAVVNRIDVREIPALTHRRCAAI
ncbi:MAG: hypothetical protein HoeaKO_09980 [Hoeflea alexandrii]